MSAQPPTPASRRRSLERILYLLAAVELVWLAGLLRFTSEMNTPLPAQPPSALDATHAAQESRLDSSPADAAIYGPPSPPRPLYGPLTPPSRVPLLSRSTRPYVAEIMEVDASLARPVDEQGARPVLSPYGWQSLGLTRGIPFAAARESAASRPPSTGAEPAASDGRRRLFSQAAPEPEPISVVYCVDLAIGEESAGRLEAVRRALRAALGSLRPADTYRVLTLQGDERALNDQPTAPTDENVRRTNAALEGLGPTPNGPITPALDRALASRGVGWIVLMAAGSGALDGADAEAARAAAARASASGVRLIALVTGDGRSTDRARALRDIAVQTRGAFAWLRPTE